MWAVMSPLLLATWSEQFLTFGHSCLTYSVPLSFFVSL